MYNILVHAHSGLRWIVLILAFYACIKYLLGWLGNKEFNSSDNKLGLFYMISMDVQLLVGLLLYFVFSPLTNTFHINMGDTVSRFYGVEHIAIMILAVVFVHVGRSLTKKATDSSSKFRRGAIMFLFSLLFILIGIPWPWRELIGKPLF